MLCCYVIPKRRTELLTCPVTLSSNSFTLLAPKSPQHFLNVDLSSVFPKSTECLFIDFRELIRTSFKFQPNRFLKLKFFIVGRVLVKTHTDLYINSSKCPLGSKMSIWPIFHANWWKYTYFTATHTVNFQGVIITQKIGSKCQVQDNPFYGVTLTPNLGSFLLLKKISGFNSQSGVKITPKMGLFYSLHELFLLLLELL